MPSLACCQSNVMVTGGVLGLWLSRSLRPSFPAPHRSPDDGHDERALAAAHQLPARLPLCHAAANQVGES